MSSERLRVALIIGSIRPGRFADKVVDWFLGQAAQRDDVDVHVIDLADLVASNEITLDGLAPDVVTDGPSFSQRIADSDAYVIVTPELNHGYPAVLKMAIDCLYEEWRAKPVSFVAYGGLVGGHRAVEQLRQVFAELHAVTLRETISFHMAWEQFDDDGAPRDPDAVNKAATVMLDQLVWWGVSLREARAERPYRV